ncbi:MAG: hypothetical protein ACRC9K_06500 [Afipia sp.]
MRWIIRPIAVVVGSIATVVGAVGLYLSFVFDPCEETVRSSTPSLDGKMLAVVFERECGATVPFNTQLSLAPTNHPFSSKKSPPFFVISGQHQLNIKWLGGKVIAVSVPIAVTIFKNEQSVGDIVVHYN